ncbi:hypothetical protein GCM10011391_37320 [Pullulanibacillus camelliae]|uniref:Uncharacterized protein n=1 Tax=Pullulanibacillus camelliae TaxID=1707096 RepID=A0A8J2YN31_9BACL|nr:hypothetical protein [Pullulanibacillus camelliae]GGE54873.1 hypothetical protein GCM10011391_37320 [Pullulanibacillus camelliae]
MYFKLEKEMTPIIKQNAVRIFKCNAVSEELPVNHRIVDIVLSQISFSQQNQFEKYRTALNKLSMAELDVLADIYIKRKVSIHYLIKKLRLSSESIKEMYLKKLIENGLLVKTSKFMYETTDWSSIKIGNMVAIEAKLSDWKTVLAQAVDNFTFADYSYVALDESICLSNEVIEKFIEKNVGILTVSGGDKLKLVYKCKKNRLTNPSDFALQRMLLCRDLICNRSKWKLL